MPSNESINAANGLAATHKKFNAWQQPGPSAYDFRSDVMTTPTASMLEAISNTTLFDDVFAEDTTTNDLESHIASLTGHEAALLVISGTMGNQIALRSHLTQPPHSVLADIRGHIVNYEAGGTSSLSGATVTAVQPANNHHLTLEDIQKHAVISDDVHHAPTRVISLENTLDGTILPLSEVRKISAFARENNIKLHLDGARLWEAIAADAGTLVEYSGLFDSVNLCFSKGLGAPIGSIVVGSKAFVAHARRIRKMIGGGTRQAGVISAAARVAVDETFLGGKLSTTHDRARAIEATWVAKGGVLAKPVETNMVWLDIQHEGVAAADWAVVAAKHGLKVGGGRLVIHYQISDDAVRRLEAAMDEVLALGQKNRVGKRSRAEFEN
ncbi:hypothetical protein LTR84_012238 [Exophiala bonariae]|uniref:Aromatic amino acid beta-eliminating lyase/threonine aldolase domain-containing protein n=1 Tax=Exophiala bonariae TaxID=1690606 RepID=A0AAV9NK16_9EURO|nr:hypothetical protein LTR84_012238 [Exophiala bonariae]